ncbi:MAG: transporter, partial [bacterium]|nr:transporter [bacterium]
TSTPGLAAATQSLADGSQAAVGYGIAYPFGVVAVVLFVQLLPRLLGRDLNQLGRDLAAADDPGRKIVRVLVEVMNPAVIGKRLSDLDVIAESNCQVPRRLEGNRLTPVSDSFTLEAGQHVLVVGREFRVPTIVSLLGRQSENIDYIMDSERERRTIVVSSKNVVGKSLAEVRPIHNFGVTVSRITRHNLEFVPRMSDEIAHGDSLLVVGEPESIENFAAYAGHRARAVDETDLISLGIGIIAGVILGMVSFDLGGRSLSLGMAGGPLLVALVLGHFGRIGPVLGFLPRASQLLLMETGLVFFLADAGVRAGATLVPVVRQYGLSLSLASLAIAFVPMICGYLLGRCVLKMNLLEIIGGVCGGMTSTPGLGVITAKTDSDIPVVSYAAAYPVALILMTVFAQVLVTVVG